MTVRKRVVDADGRSAELTQERWEHICDRHPEIAEVEALVLRAVQAPDRRRRGRVPNEEWFYLKTDAPSNWLKVVVAYGEGRGHIVTAHPRRSMP